MKAKICFRLRKETWVSDLFWLSDEQMDCLRLFVPKSHDTSRVDDRLVSSGIVLVNRNGPAIARCAQHLRPT